MRSTAVGARAGRWSRPGGERAPAWARRAGWLTVLGVVAVLWLLASASPAGAHAVFVSASPAPGASLARPPATLRILFSESLAPKLSGVELEASPGRPVRPRSAGVDPHDSSAYELGLPPLRPDRYTVIWHTTSQIDGHFRSGSYTFTVLEPGGAGLPAEPTQLPTPLQ
ncbi:MAG: copper resistance CopC family protein, partial [Trebonia sp.]